MRLLLVVLAAVTVAVPTPVLAQGRECTEALPDSLAQAMPPIYRECDVTRPAERQGEHRTLSFQAANLGAALRMECLRASIGFVVDARGRVEEQTVVLVETNSTEFGRAVLASLGRLRYQPAQLDGQAVRQWTIYHREGTPSMVGPIRVNASGQQGARAPRDPPRVTVGAGC